MRQTLYNNLSCKMSLRFVMGLAEDVDELIEDVRAQYSALRLECRTLTLCIVSQRTWASLSVR